MVRALLFEAIIAFFPFPTLPNQPGKPEYASIQYTHRLLTVNTVSIEITRGGVQNGHLGLVLTLTQYALVIQVPSVHPTNPSRTPTIPAWASPFGKKKLI